MNKALFAALIGIVVAALVAGFSTVGGPGYARTEKHDPLRAQDLRMLHRFHRCNVMTAGTKEDGISPRGCGGDAGEPQVFDPVTKERYALKTTVNGGFEVCATFRTQEEQRNTQAGGRSGLQFDGQVGCMRYSPQQTNPSDG